MAIITTGNAFGTTDPVTSTTLNNIANAATFNDPVDETSLELITSGVGLIGKLGIKDEGVTLAKMQHVGTDKVLGRTSANTGDVEEVGIIVGGSGDAGLLFDNDDMLDNSDTAGGSATRGATQQSIKAYVDSNGITQTTGTAPYFGVRAWANYNGVTNTLNASGNISGVVRNGTGDYTFTFTTAMPDGFYSTTIGYDEALGSQGNGHGVGYIRGQTSTDFRVRTYNENNSGDPMNKNIVNVSVIC